MEFLTWWDLPKRAWVLILAQFAIILFLAASLVSNYLNNIYYQNYVNSISPILIPVLSIAFGVTSATIAIKLYLGIQEIRSLQEEVDSQGRRRGKFKRSKRTSPTSSLPPTVTIHVTDPSLPTMKPLTTEAKPVESPAITAEKKEPSQPPGKDPQKIP